MLMFSSIPLSTPMSPSSCWGTWRWEGAVSRSWWSGCTTPKSTLKSQQKFTPSSTLSTGKPFLTVSVHVLTPQTFARLKMQALYPNRISWPVATISKLRTRGSFRWLAELSALRAATWNASSRSQSLSTTKTRTTPMTTLTNSLNSALEVRAQATRRVLNSRKVMRTFIFALVPRTNRSITLLVPKCRDSFHLSTPTTLISLGGRVDHSSWQSKRLILAKAPQLVKSPSHHLTKHMTYQKPLALTQVHRWYIALLLRRSQNC